VANRTVSVRLVAEVGQYVSGMSTAAAATMRLGDTADKSTAKAKGGFDLANKSALIMGGAVVAGLGMAISKSMEFEKSMSGIQAATHASACPVRICRTSPTCSPRAPVRPWVPSKTWVWR
jgi:hypothetical protein